jgi:hypothetical protein
MANELKVTLGIIYANGAMADTVAVNQMAITQSALEFQGDVVTVPTGSEADLATPNISTLGFVYLKNLDSTNFVQWGPKSGGVMVPAGRLLPGESAVLRLEPGMTLRWTADTAAVKVLAKIYND